MGSSMKKLVKEIIYKLNKIHTLQLIRVKQFRKKLLSGKGSSSLVQF